MTLRKLLFWFHLTIGSAAGLVILVMSVTGACLAFERQILFWADHGKALAQRIGNHSSSEGKLAMENLRAGAERALGNSPSVITVRAGTAAPVEFSLGRERTVFVDPYTGAVLGEGSRRARAFFSQVENVHRWLAFPATSRATGRAITGACNLAFLGLVLSGPFLWWPKEWNWANLRRILFFRTGVSGRAMFWNWHHAIGIWCVVPLFFIVTSGVVMSYPWANNLLYRVTGNEPPKQQRTAPGEQIAQHSGVRSESSLHGNRHASALHHGPGPEPANLDLLFARAEQQVEGWKSVVLRIPASPSPTFTFSIDRGDGGRPDLRSQLTLDPQTGSVVAWEPFSSYNAGRKLRVWARFTHTGEAGGWAGQCIALLVASGSSLLAFSGLSLAWMRLRRYRQRESRRASLYAESLRS